MKKQLPKMLKTLKIEDRVLIVGTTKRPFVADLKPLSRVYKKIVLVPRPDYASRFGKYMKTCGESVANIKLGRAVTTQSGACLYLCTKICSQLILCLLNDILT